MLMSAWCRFWLLQVGARSASQTQASELSDHFIILSPGSCGITQRAISEDSGCTNPGPPVAKSQPRTAVCVCVIAS